MSPKVKITDTTLRDAHQSLLATRLHTDDMLPILKKIDAIGFHSLEMWGGATFDTAMRFLKEDPWERLKKIRKICKNTKLQMLLRGQNLVGYRHYADDVVELFLEKAIENGLDIIRVFDALNDPRNMKWSMKCAKRFGAHVQATICYTTSPVHDITTFVSFAVELAAMDADSICIKDMAGLLTPTMSYDLVTKLKDEVQIPIQLHSHYTSGMAAMAYLKGIEAGADIIDTAISPFSTRTSQPATETMIAVLEKTEYDTGLKLNSLLEIADYFRVIRGKYEEFETRLRGVDTAVLAYQIPGGMLSNLENQLKAQNASDRFQEVLKEIPVVREEMGYPPLVTPASQIVGTQSTLNVILGKRYKIIPNEVKEYFRGKYGRPPAPLSSKISELVIGDEKPITQRPADLLSPEIPTIPSNVRKFIKSDEDLLSYLLFPQVALGFLETRYKKARAAKGLTENEFISAIAAIVEYVQLDAEKYQASFKPINGTTNGSLWKVASRQEQVLNSWGE